MARTAEPGLAMAHMHIYGDANSGGSTSVRWIGGRLAPARQVPAPAGIFHARMRGAGGVCGCFCPWPWPRLGVRICTCADPDHRWCAPRAYAAYMPNHQIQIS